MDEITLDAGKYRFYQKDHILYCDRYDGEWRDFIGDNAVHVLFDKCLELQEEVDRLRKLLYDAAK